MQDLSQFFLLRKDITFLNFGSFGSCVKPVFEKYQQFQLELEQEPVEFITVTGPKYLEVSRKALAGYLNCQHDDVVYVTNPSYAVNIIAKSMALQPGDVVLLSPAGTSFDAYPNFEARAEAFRRLVAALPGFTREVSP